jgi:hypothetical protein
MSFGYGVSDILAIVNIAWDVYKSCKDAPKSFGNIESEVLSFHAVLKEAEEMVSASPPSGEQQERLKAVMDGCHRVIKDLQTLVNEYERLATSGRRTWDRLGWADEKYHITELRARLTSNATLLNTWIRYVSSYPITLDILQSPC